MVRKLLRSPVEELTSDYTFAIGTSLYRQGKPQLETLRQMHFTITHLYTFTIHSGSNLMALKTFHYVK